MSKSKEQTINEILNDFFEWQSAKSVENELLDCFIAAIGSESMNSWTANDREKIAFLYKRLIVFVQELENIYIKTVE